MQLDSSFYAEEIRSGFLITEKQKKIWAVQLQLLKEFDSVCQKHHLTWFADYGTLLGAVRHKGFIPWDTDIDVSMFRDDYMKLLSIASDEFHEPYFFQNAYTDILVLPFSKLRNSNTTSICFPDLKGYNQGISIDIFPMDDVPADNDSSLLEIQRELWMSIRYPSEIQKALEINASFLFDTAAMNELLNLSLSQRMLEFELFNLQHFGESEYVNFLVDSICNTTFGVKREWCERLVYLPFECLSIPAPKEYEQVLTKRYGNWHEYVQYELEYDEIILDPDVPYTQYINTPERNKS